MKTAQLVGLIDRLTIDNDERQELWLRYLENSDISELSDYLEEIRKQYSEEQLLQITVWKQLENPSDFNLQWIFDNFTELEQSVIQLLILDVPLQQICSIKGIGLARLRHVISVIRENKAWEQFDGIEDESDGS